jgi:hypothetical protein
MGLVAKKYRFLFNFCCEQAFLAKLNAFHLDFEAKFDSIQNP